MQLAAVPGSRRINIPRRLAFPGLGDSINLQPTPKLRHIFVTLAMNNLRIAPRSPLRPLLYSLSRPLHTSSPLRSRLRQPGEPTGPNEPARHTNSSKSKSNLTVWPIVFIFVGGSLLFKKIVDDRKGQVQNANKAKAGHSPSRP